MNKMSESVRVVIACALGALVGSLLSLECVARLESAVWQTVGVCLGVLVGGLVGYLSYRFNEVCKACKRCVEEEAILASLWSCMRITCVCVYRYIILSVLLSLVTGMFVFYGSAILIGGTSFVVFLFTQQGSGVDLMGVMKFIATISLVVGIGVPFSAGVINTIVFFITRNTRDLDSPKDAIEVVFKYFCHLLPQHAVPYMYTKSCYGIKVLYSGMSGGVVKVFRYIHSDARIICFVGATIGSITGFVAGSAFIGCAAGAVMGYLEYRVVSVRLLKLVPSGDQ